MKFPKINEIIDEPKGDSKNSPNPLPKYSLKNTARAKKVKSWLAIEIFKTFSP